MDQAEKDKMFSSFLSTSTIFIVDFNSASRSRLMRSMIDLGAKTTSVKTYKQYDAAVAELQQLKPQIVFSDYKLGKRSAFDLLQEYKPIHDADKNAIFALITANSSQSLVAQAAEEDVDAFILKPFTIEVFKKVFYDAVMNKINPSEYLTTIEEGKKLLFTGKPEESLDFFMRATKMHAKPALAYFYHGQAEKMLEMLKEAETGYKSGLTFNTIHYKCLTALFDMLFDEKRFEEAYDVVKTITQYFPANPKRLASVIRLAIQTNHFEDIENLYTIFMDLEDRTDELISYICAGLVICGKYYLMNKNTEKALNIYNGLKNSLSGKNKYLLYIIENLVLFNMGSEATSFFKRFPPEDYTSDEYMISEFLSEEYKLSDEDAIKKGTALVAKNKHNHCVYYILIKRLLKLKKMEDAKFYKVEALRHFPYKKKQFSNMKNG